MDQQAKEEFLNYLRHHSPPTDNYMFEVEENRLDSTDGWVLKATPEGLYHTAFLIFKLLLTSSKVAVPLSEKDLPRFKGKPLVWFVREEKKAEREKSGDIDLYRFLAVLGVAAVFGIFLIGLFRSIELFRLWW